MNINETLPRYTASMPLQTEFITNADACGDHVFTQIARKGNICLYKRTGVADGRPKDLELFKVKTIKAGAALPGGNVVEKDYESYPGKAAFGKSAMSIGGIGADERATQLFDIWAANPDLNPLEVSEAAKGQPVTNPIAEQAVVRVAKTRVRSDKNAVYVIPDGEFTQADFAKANGLPERGRVYGILQQQVKSGLVTPVGLKKSGKGRPQAYFVKAQS